MSIKCTFENCDKKFSCSSNMHEHMNTHIGNKPHKCEICEKYFSYRRYLQAHQESHREPTVCNKCGVTFTRKFKLKKHQELYCCKVYQCKDCPKVYKKQGCYLTHLSRCRVKDGKNEKPPVARKLRARKQTKISVCTFCKSEFIGKKNMIAHIRAKHEKIRFNCKKCSKSFSYNCSLKKHYEKVHSLNNIKKETREEEGE
ncbi:hypothetical protein GINT2_000656 [Glugoides intestinalis]